MKNILKKSLIIFIVFLLGFSFNLISNAESENNVNYDDQIALLDNASSEQIEENSVQKNYFYAGSDDVNLSNPVDGDVFICTSGTVNISSTVNGNVFALASSVNVLNSANIQGSLFNTSYSLSIDGSIGSNVYNVSKELNFTGTIDLDLFSASNKSTLSGNIYRNANISSDDLKFTDSASINGDLNYSSKEQVSISDNMVKGKTSYTIVSTDDEETSFKAKDFVMSLISFIVLALVVFAILKWLKIKFMDSDLEFFKILPKYLLYGLIGLIVTPILATLLLMSEVTLSLTVILIALYILALIVASSIVVVILAKLLAKKITQKYTNSNITLMTVLSILVICLAYKLLQLIPVFGTILTFAFALVGLGILLKNICPTKTKEEK